MSRLSKHIGEGEKVKINGEEFILKPLGTQYFGDFMSIAKGFSGSKSDDDLEGMFKNFTDETKNSINKVIIDTLKKSIPYDEDDFGNQKKYDEEIDIFAGKNIMKLLPVIVKMNGMGEGESRAKNKLDAIKRMRANKDAKDASSLNSK